MTATFYDRRAERQVAAGLAEQHRADAAVRLAEVELTHIRAEAARAELADRQRATADRRKAALRKAGRKERAARLASIRAGLTGLRARLVALVPTVVGVIAMGAPILIGWNGQLQTARSVLHLGGLAWIYPVALEGGAWWLAYLMHRAIANSLPTGRLRVWMWLLALLAAGMNFWHGEQAYGLVGGAGLALSSLLGIGLWELTAAHTRHAANGTKAGQVRQTLARWLRFPRLSLAASSIAAACGTDTDHETAWRAAWIDRYGVGPESSRRDRRLARLVVGEQWKADRQAARRGDLLIVSGRILRMLPALPSVTTDRSAVTPGTPSEQHKLTGRAADLLVRTRAAIATGNLPETPSANAIRKHFGGRMEHAIAVRKAIASLHAVSREDIAS